jgi:hypothetical protein
MPQRELFAGLRHARHLIAGWARRLQPSPPHTSLDGLTPREYFKQSEKDQTRNRIDVLPTSIRGAGLPQWPSPTTSPKGSTACIGLAAAGLVYLTGSALRFFAPDLSAAFPPAYGVTILAGTAFCLRLLLQPATT